MTSIAVTKNIWTPTWVQQVTQGQWLQPPAELSRSLVGLSIDSRTIKPGQAFLAIKGDQFDGHRFIDKAINAGARIAIIEKHDGATYDADVGILRVDKAINALHRLAVAYRAALRASGCHIIAVVGSNGKTTTRHLIHTVLSSKLNGVQSPKSFNNHLGVPLTLLGASLEDDFLVAEVGTNHPGEINALGELLKPDSAVITCIGQEHMEFFGDLKGVANEEAAITRHLPQQGKVFIEADAYEWVRDSPSFNTDTHVVVYGADTNAATATEARHGCQSLVVGNTTINLPLIAPHDRLNALAAVEVGRAAGVPDDLIKTALESVSPMPGRLEVKQFGPVTVIDDTYNANPDSTRAALDVLAKYATPPKGQRIVILGDMLELGPTAEASHLETGRVLASLMASDTVQRAILIGPYMAWVLDECHNADNITHYTDTDDSTPALIAELIRPNDVILIKGSRGMELEKLLPALQSRFDP